MTASLTEGGLMEARLEQAAEAGLRVAVAESLTGGLLADAFVSVPGASTVFSGGLICYDTELKGLLLGVDTELLGRCGPVDPEVARQMAKGVREACAVTRGSADRPMPADIGLATTGVAGPDADPQTGQPPGTVWVAISSRLGERAVALHLDGDREQIRAETVRRAVRELARELDALGERQLP